VASLLNLPVLKEGLVNSTVRSTKQREEKMIFIRIVLAGFLIAIGSMGVMASASAETPVPINDSASLNEIKEAKGVFLIDFTNPKKTAFYLDVIKGTHQGFVKQGVKPDMILVFIGQTVKYLSTKPDDELELEFESELKSIAQTVKELHALGVRMEVCAVATKAFGVDNQTILPGMKVIGDGFISLIGWQTQGYKLVPIF
jgi:intracellular sulfur oxidation DsrE/DsrF family protein